MIKLSSVKDLRPTLWDDKLLRLNPENANKRIGRSKEEELLRYQVLERLGGEATGLEWREAAKQSNVRLNASDIKYDLAHRYIELIPDGTSLPTVWIEKTIVRNRPDRIEGDNRLGSALWSPQKSKAGADIYSQMRQVQDGDIVLHLTDNEGFSAVSAAAATVDDSFIGLDGTDWAGEPGYRIELQDFRKIDPPLLRSEFLKGSDIEDEMQSLYQELGGKGLFFNKVLDLNQGAYLTKASAELVAILNKAYHRKAGSHLPGLEAFDEIAGPSAPEIDMTAPLKPYSIEDATAGLFMGRENFVRILHRLRNKKNVILQGAPGVGKTFVSRRLAYALLGEKDVDRVAMVQFHQSYSYEDFIQGYRPADNGSFQLKYGPFYRFCEEARNRPEVPFVFIIDEINRGNLSKVMGELMMLIEADKRSAEWALPLAYSSAQEEPFFVPPNVYLIGMMNTADRSLAVVDYALRRRFSFLTLSPCFDTLGFKEALEQSGVSRRLSDHIVGRMSHLNRTIADDRTNLGPGFCIGHSFFCPTAPPASEAEWFQSVIEDEIGPLLSEYYFDDPEKADELTDQLAL